jgi:OHCU decarboxylase
MRLEDLNALDEKPAVGQFLRCCGSSRWARLMEAARPFASAAAMALVADATWSALDREDWLEAFAAHPTIGAGGSGLPAVARISQDVRAKAGGSSGSGAAGEEETERWSDDEQAGVAGAVEATRRRLAGANREYQDKFGYIFIVCATGRTAGEMLDILERRLKNDRAGEIQVAAEEQRKITRLRLAKLLEGEQGTIT